MECFSILGEVYELQSMQLYYKISLLLNNASRTVFTTPLACDTLAVVRAGR